MFATAMKRDAKEFITLKLEQYPHLWELLSAALVELHDGPLFACYPDGCRSFHDAVTQLYDGLSEIEWPNCYDPDAGLFFSAVDFDAIAEDHADSSLYEVSDEYFIQLAMGDLRECV